jgi:hypothetical protein
MPKGFVPFRGSIADTFLRLRSGTDFQHRRGVLAPRECLHSVAAEDKPPAVRRKDKGEDFTYDEWKVGGSLNLQLKPILTPHLPDVDINKEQHLVLGAGYPRQGNDSIRIAQP